MQGNIYGNIYSKGGSITINGKCIGGEIETVNGKILINGDIIDNSNIISENGTIIVENVKDSVIIGNDILIKNAEGCKIIGHKVKILKSIGNEIIGDYLHINELVDKKDNKNIIYSFLFNIGKIIDTLDTLYKDYLNLSKFLIDLKKKKENLLFKLNDGINYDTEYKDYYEIERKVRKGEIKLNKLSDEKKQVLEKVLNIIKDRRQELKSDLNTTTNLEKKTLTEKNQLNNKIKSLEIKMNEFKVSNLEKGYFVQKSNGDSFDNRLYSVPVSVKELLNSKIGFEKKIKILKGDIDVSYVDYLNDLFGSFVSNLKLQEVYTEKTNTKDGRERFNTVRSFHRTVLVADDNIQEQVDNIKESHDILVNNVLKAKMLDIGINGIGLVIKNDGTVLNKGDQLFLELKDEGGYIKFNFIVDRKEANENYIRFGGHFEGIDLNTELKLLNIKKSYENSVKS
ncbi:PilZ domain-containing protein [Candidatus Vampirococcus lugosii]|uniref:PilZ domain-containing protein n=1 Tax=Candidatus Vampirococcus lugosii TaxID=2789015 RepID=A0ABS5QLR6_9BACT|nr:PilZ domain-containing protein [Candidatus Vampirococcus lugosii]MBS8122141.1 hypothetical protein [Candidatus Vampirococcus lugosii]